MARDLILGTAGHIDHGKTSLVKALTGVDCDRLPEEKARGITIDIGFATLDLGDYRLGVVDVPGHERFIKNMLAGATGVDIAVLVVAADDSVMPQTREHLEILKLLGLRHGVIALTKCDLATDEMLQLVEMEIRDLVAGSFLENAPIVRTAAHSGLGIGELKSAIREECGKVEANATLNWFRLPIDRSFIVQGHGVVVTGSVHSGTLKVGDELEWLPSGEKVRVRSLQNHDHPVEEVHRGQRAAINLAGVRHDDVRRGQELAFPSYLKPSRVVTVRLHCLPEMKKPIKHRAPVRFHIGTLEVMGAVSILDADSVKPGDWVLAQLFLEEPVTCTWGQPFVVRGASATVTLGGGQVLQPTAKKVRRRHLEVLERIESLWTGNADQRVLTVAWFGGFSGFTIPDLVRGANIAPQEAETIVQKLRDEHKLATIAVGGHRQVLLHAEVLKELDERILAAVGRLHEETPLMSAHDRSKVQAQFDYVGDDSLVSALVDRLVRQKKLVGDARRIARADFKPKLSTSLRKLKDKVVAAYQEAGFNPPDAVSFASQAGGNASSMKDLFEVCQADGDLVQISDSVFLHSEFEAEMRLRVATKLSGETGATVAEIRDLLGTTRKFAVPFCEYLDRIGLTRRDGDLRRLASPQPATS
ncbi:MAG: selenocysteine-specific translation elongation factor [Gemmataceae bacterium]|nr:selenocysteine-specific translation elongation factor [Gemmataceae bacterium]